MTEQQQMLSGKALVDCAVAMAQEKKAENIVLFNPGAESGIAEWFLICEGSNLVHTRAIADSVVVGLKKENTAPWHREGLEEGRWILLDYSDVVINILIPEVREYYRLESLWAEYERFDVASSEL